jgi:hypothetical protein
MSVDLGGLIQALVLLVGIPIGLYQYGRAKRFERLRNLNGIWQRFVDTAHFARIFDLCDSEDAQLARHSRQEKLQYLGSLEEVSLFVEMGEADRAYAVYLFQWHFHYVFSDATVSALFWENLGGPAERDARYWEKSRRFACLCRPQA